jgi:hypothetical protein
MRMLVIVLLTTALAACSAHKGPAQNAGEKIDRAVDKVSDTVDPKGPAQKAGRAIDRATGS